MGTTPHLGLTLPASGTTGWATPINANFTALDTAIYNLQQGGTTGPAGPQGPAGAVGMIFAGQWNSSIAYVVTDVVTFNGGTYFAIANNTNTEPDTNPNTWAVLAAPGAAGPAGPTGPTGPQGPAGGGTTVTFPIAVGEGGTGATTAAAARAALVAAESGVNSDITSLQSVAASGDAGSQVGINIVGSSGANILAIQVSNGTVYSSWQANGVISCAEINMSGGILCGTGQFSGGVITNQIGDATPGDPVDIVSVLLASLGALFQGSPPAAASGQVGIGGTLASTATAGGGQAVPGTVLTYVDCTVFISGVSVPGKMPIFAA